MEGVLKKAAKTLNRQVQVIFHVEREDDRFYETHDLQDVISDPNIVGKRVTFLRIELREEEPEKGSRRDWIARVMFIAERRWDIKYIDRDEIHVDISTNDKNWALLLADELEPQVERTINRSKLPRWPLVGVGAFLFYIMVKLNHSIADKIPLEHSHLILPIFTLLVTTVTFVIWVQRKLRGKSSGLATLLGPETVFLWGDEEKRFREHEQTRRNLFWGVMVAFAVSAMASIAVTIM